MPVVPVITADGSLTAVHPVLGQMYHSVRGAAGEAKHVYIDAGLLTLDSRNARILDMGFGTGLNGWMTLCCRPSGMSVRYVAVEKYPLAPSDQLMHSDSPLFRDMVSAPWNSKTPLTQDFIIEKVKADILELDVTNLAPLNLVYWDAFAPDSQPELWTEELFARIRSAMSPGGVLVTYSSKGTVKQALRAAGFEVHRLPGALGKHHMLRALNV